MTRSRETARPAPAAPAETSTEALAEVTASAALAAGPLAALPGAERAVLLRAVAEALDAQADDLVPLAEEETALGATRLAGELARTTGQLRLFADVVTEGSYLEAIIDTADPAATPPRPDVRRMLHPLGPVAVYAASNFPFAFSVAGGDTASALAAGCPVVVKAHHGHARLSALTAQVVRDALASTGAPDGTFAVVGGRSAGEALVVDPRVRAAAFTGSVQGGRALFDRASTEREDPIPFYGELGSINPVVVTAAAARERAAEIAAGLLASFTLGVGQFCTKPGVVLVPEGGGVEQHLAAVLPDATGGRMLTPSIWQGFTDAVRSLAAVPGVSVLGRGVQAVGDTTATPLAYATDVAHLLEHSDRLLEECFGPACLLVRYADGGQLRAAVAALPGALTMTVHATPADHAELSDLLPALRDRAGRLVWNGWPTGVAVNRAMHHGGPWPSTTGSLHTSVGATAIRRFLRPVAYQGVPDALLPRALHDANPLRLLRTLDGEPTREPVRRRG